MTESYKGSINIEFEEIPPVRLKTIVPMIDAPVWEKLAHSTKRRFFTLDNDWFLTLDVPYQTRLNGQIRIPQRDKNGELIIYDGASIPIPWLVSLLTIGILRPLGVMLVASIVHDFAYKYGHLPKLDDQGQETEIKIKRHVADKLLRDIIGTVNGLPIIGYIGWYFVRLGWVFVKYNKQPRGGKKPYSEYTLFFIIILALTFIIMLTCVSFVLSALAITYILLYVVSIILLKRLEKKKTKQVNSA